MVIIIMMMMMMMMMMSCIDIYIYIYMAVGGDEEHDDRAHSKAMRLVAFRSEDLTPCTGRGV